MLRKSGVILILIFILFILSCKKEQKYDHSTLHGFVKHHHTKIPGAVVYIKYNATEFPGSSASLYDSTYYADSLNGYYRISHLSPGNYYIYSEGYDSSIFENVKGGIPITIDGAEISIELDIPVTE